MPIVWLLFKRVLGHCGAPQLYNHVISISWLSIIAYFNIAVQFGNKMMKDIKKEIIEIYIIKYINIRYVQIVWETNVQSICSPIP